MESIVYVFAAAHQSPTPAPQSGSCILCTLTPVAPTFERPLHVHSKGRVARRSDRYGLRRRDSDGDATPERPPSLAEHVCRVIRDDILTGRQPAGARLTEAIVMERTGVSRTPVREGLRMLEGEGLVITYRSRGTFVTYRLTPDEAKLLLRRAPRAGAPPRPDRRRAHDARDAGRRWRTCWRGSSRRWTPPSRARPGSSTPTSTSRSTRPAGSELLSVLRGYWTRLQLELSERVYTTEVPRRFLDEHLQHPRRAQGRRRRTQAGEADETAHRARPRSARQGAGQMAALKFGLAVENFTPAAEDARRSTSIVAYARRAEELGYDSLWAWDHMFLGTGRPFPFLESLSTLTAARRATPSASSWAPASSCCRCAAPPCWPRPRPRSSSSRAGGSRSAWRWAGMSASSTPAASRSSSAGRIFEENLALMKQFWTGERVTGDGPRSRPSATR